jgi:hypothetical protein
MRAKRGFQALERGASKIVGRNTEEARLMRAMLQPLYRDRIVVLSSVSRLDWEMRKEPCAIILGIDKRLFHGYKICDMFAAAGDQKSTWSLAGITT